MEERKKLAITPTLGKGFSIGQDISLDVPVKKSKTKASAELAKVIYIFMLIPFLCSMGLNLIDGLNA